MTNENIFDQSFATTTESPIALGAAESFSHSRDTETAVVDEPPTAIPAVPVTRAPPKPAKALDAEHDDDALPSLSSPSRRPQRSSLKRTYTDVAGLSLQNRLSEALSQPFQANQNVTQFPAYAPPVRAGSLAIPESGRERERERAPHGHRNAQAQAIFTTEATTPWTITAANDMACLVFGVTRAEVRKLGIMEVIQDERRRWLEDKLRNPDSGSARQARPPDLPSSINRSASGKVLESTKTGSNGPAGNLASMGQGLTAKLLSKPPARQTYQSRRSQTENGLKSPPRDMHHPSHKSRGVLLCGDVVPIRKLNGSTGSASLWVKEKGHNLIWVLEEIAEDVAMLTVDEIGSILRGSGDLEAIFGLDRVRNGMDVHRLIPAWPKLTGTNTGAVDYEAIAQLRRFTARTSNDINIPVTIDQTTSDAGVFRVSSFPHIAGIIVVNPTSMRISSSNSVFSAALFGHAQPDGLPIVDLIPGFDKILRVMTDEDKIALIDGMVIPEHSFRRARALIALREGSADAAAIFLRPSGVPAQHRDGAEIMIDVQMRVVKSDRDPIYNETVADAGGFSALPSSEVVFALWITYSRQLHAANHGIGPVSPLMSRPGTPPRQPIPTPNIEEGFSSPAVETPATEISTPIPLPSEPGADPRPSIDSIPDSVLPVNPADGEPFEHPSPDLIAAGVRVIMKKRIDDFAILEEMGQGAYGQVKLARYRKSAAKKMVIKYVTKRRILVDTWHRDRRLGTVPLEIHVLDFLRRDGLQHPNIVEMADFFEDDINYYIEMVPHGLPGMDLFDYIELRVTMEERECRKIFRQVARALQHLHITAKVVHRDIKDENVILDGEGRVKLADFGSAAYIKSGPFDVFVGTIDYAAPEVLQGLPYRGKEQDVWALGILLYTIVYKENPFYSIDEIMDHDLRVPYVMSEDCIDLIRQMLDRDVERRIGIQAVLDHPWCTYEDDDDDAVADETAKAMPAAPATVEVAA